MPERNLVAVPDTSTDRAALAEPIACGWHAVRLAKRWGRAPGCRDGPCDRRRRHRSRRGAQPQGPGRGGRHAGGTQRERRAYLGLDAATTCFAPEDVAGLQLFDLVVDGGRLDATRAAASAAAHPAA
jgi:hypothetical protein